MDTPRRHPSAWIGRLRTRHAKIVILAALYVIIGIGFLTTRPPLPSVFGSLSQGWVWLAAAVFATATARMSRASSVALGALSLVLFERITILLTQVIFHDRGWFSIAFYLPLLVLIILAALTPTEEPERTHLEEAV